MTRRQALLRVELPLALPAIIAGLRIAIVTIIALATIVYVIYDRGSRRADPHRARRGPVQDGADRGGRTCDPAGAGGRRAARARAAAADAVGAGTGELAEVSQCTNSSRRSGSSRTTAPLPGHPGLPSLIAPGAGDAEGGGDRRRDLARAGAPARRVARAHAPRLVRGDQRRQHRPGAAEPRGAGDRRRVPRPRPDGGGAGAGHPRGAADRHERILGGRRRRPRPGRRRARDGHERLGDPRDAWSCRWRCRCCSRASARRRCS